jgi:hypothetical protein
MWLMARLFGKRISSRVYLEKGGVGVDNDLTRDMYIVAPLYQYTFVNKVVKMHQVVVLLQHPSSPSKSRHK